MMIMEFLLRYKSESVDFVTLIVWMDGWMEKRKIDYHKSDFTIGMKTAASDIAIQAKKKQQQQQQQGNRLTQFDCQRRTCEYERVCAHIRTRMYWLNAILKLLERSKYDRYTTYMCFCTVRNKIV